MLAIMFHKFLDRDLCGVCYFDRNAKAQENNLSPDKTPLGVCDQWVLKNGRRNNFMTKSS